MQFPTSPYMNKTQTYNKTSSIQTHIRHEKQIQRLEKEIRHKYAMNMLMQEMLIKVICAAQHHPDIPNYKFAEMLLILDKTFAHLKAQAPTAEACDSLSR